MSVCRLLSGVTVWEEVMSKSCEKRIAMACIRGLVGSSYIVFPLRQRFWIVIVRTLILTAP